MKRRHKRTDFYSELRWRLKENKKLYEQPSAFVIFDSAFGKFIASHLGVNPWKVLIPIAFVVVVFCRFLVGRYFSELVLRVLGG